MGKRENAPQGAPVDGRRLGSCRAAPATRVRQERSWLVSLLRVEPERRDGRHGASEVVRTASPEKKTLWRGGSESSPPHRSRQRWCARAVFRMAEAGPFAVKRRVSRGWIVARRSGAAWSEPALGWEHACGRRGASRALGARAVHGCSCRQSVAEVGEKHLHRGPTRVAARRTEGTRRSVNRRARSWTGASSAFRAKRVRRVRRDRNREREPSLGRKVEDRADGRRPGLIWASPLTGWRRAGPGSVAGRAPDERREARAIARDGVLARAATATTEDVRDRDIGFGSPNRKVQGVCSQRERSVREPPWRSRGDTYHELRSTKHRDRSCRGEKPRHASAGTAARTARPASVSRQQTKMPRRVASAAWRLAAVE
jgi:hypothetical protein